jgi:hypothetical protein
MKHQSKFNSEQQQQNTAQRRTEGQPPMEFTTAEELLRYDAEHTDVPPGIARRLQESAGDLPRPKSSWWKRLFG